MISRLLAALAFGTGLYLSILVAAAAIHGTAGLDGLWLSRRLPSPITSLLAGACGLGLMLFASGYLRGFGGRAALAAGLLVIVGWALADGAAFLRLVREGTLLAGSWIPASALVGALFAILAGAVLAYPALSPEGPAKTLLLGLLVPLAAPFVQFATFGTTRYEREADVALVMGAGVFPGGEVSQAAADRVEEAVRLYQRGLVTRVRVLAGDENEGAGMAAHAVAKGVPEAVVSYRADCVNTERAAALSAVELGHSGERALVVSHYYHLPRIRLLYAREGATVRTVPAVMERRLLREPYYLVREVGSTYHELLFRSRVGPIVKRYLAARRVPPAPG